MFENLDARSYGSVQTGARFRCILSGPALERTFARARLDRRGRCEEKFTRQRQRSHGVLIELIRCKQFKKEITMRTLAFVLTGAMLALATAAPISAATAPKTAALPVVNLVATADQKFKPDHVTLHVGKRQTLRFTSQGGYHGIVSKDLGIPSTMIGPAKPVSVNVTPKKAGTYKVPCSVVCGPGHADMSLTVTVKP